MRGDGLIHLIPKCHSQLIINKCDSSAMCMAHEKDTVCMKWKAQQLSGCTIF